MEKEKEKERKVIASKDERKRWIEEVLEIAEREGVGVWVVDDYYDNGPLARFKCPDNPKNEAGVYVWYRKVEIFSELGTELRAIKSGYDSDELKWKFESLIKENIGYEEHQDYDGFVKEVETPDEAVREVKSLLDRKIWEIEEELIEAYESTRDILRGVEYRLAPEKEKTDKSTISVSKCFKVPEWVVKELIERKDQDKEKA